MKKIIGLGIALMTIIAFSAFGNTESDALLVRFSGAIGVIPVSNVVVNAGVTTVSANTVRGIAPSGQIWRIADLHANVSVDGHIRVQGRGLLLGGGNSIGTNANQRVFATLFCGAATSATAFSSEAAGVALDTDGDFTIDDQLSSLPPTPCESPVLLIRTTSGTRPWFAAGIPR